MQFLNNFKLIRRDAWIFIALAYAITWIIDAFIIVSGQSVYKATLLVALRMWAPGLAGIAVSRYYRKPNLKRLLTSAPGFKYLIISYAAPIAIGLISIAFLAISNITIFGVNSQLIEKYHGLRPVLFRVLGYAPTVGMFAPIIACLGEEIGWRGYLFPQTGNLSPNFRRFFNGCVWAVYHWPLILFSDYASSSNKVYSLLMFSIFIIFQGALICWIQEQSKSIWTSVLFHATHNMWIIGILPVFYIANARTPYYIGEGGVFLTAAYAISFLVFSYAQKFICHAPSLGSEVE